MTHSQTAADLVSSFEGFSATAYQDQNGVWTIGFGHAQGVKQYDVTTKDAALRWLSDDLNTADNCINRMVTVPLNQNQFDALCSFIFNIGCGNFSKSTAFKCLQAGNYQSACDAMGMWNKIAHQVSGGLDRRRKAEQVLFMEAVDASQ